MSFQMIAIASKTEKSASWSSDLVKGHSAILKETIFEYFAKTKFESFIILLWLNFFFDFLKSFSAQPFSAEMTVLVWEPIINLE
jgi:hypothetical protein